MSRLQSMRMRVRRNIPRNARRARVLLVGDRRLPSFGLRSNFLVPEMMRLGMATEALDRAFVGRGSMIRDGVVVFLKSLQPWLVELARRRGNRIVYAVVDQFAHGQEDPEVDAALASNLLDGIIFSTESVRAAHPAGRCAALPTTVIDSFWDPRLAKNRAEGFRLVYFGSVVATSVDVALLQALQSEGLVDDVVDASGPTLDAGGFAALSRCSCHFSVRGASSAAAAFKPNAKIFTAAATESNIILGRSASALGVLGGDYPFYTSQDPDEIRATITRARHAYGGPEWEAGLKWLRPIREATSVGAAARRHVDFLRQLL